jgi:beta-galactosidase
LRKNGYFFYQSQWTTRPMLHLFPHWKWKGKEGQIVTVTCFTNCENVELFLNGKSYGVKGYVFPRRGQEAGAGAAAAAPNAVRTTPDLHLSWDVPMMWRRHSCLRYGGWRIGRHEGLSIIFPSLICTM